MNIELKTIINDKAIVYCRVSSANQKNDLESQIKAMELFCLGGGIVIDKIISEVGGGLNFKRKVFINLMKSVRMGDVKHIVVAHQDRLARFGFDFPHGICIMVRL